MKTIKHIGGFVFATAVLALASCDKIKDSGRLIDQGVMEVKSERCVLLEDYTGVRCVNCPDAAAEIKVLQAAFGKNLVAVGMYPMAPSSLTLPYPGDMDLRTEEAQAYADAYQIAQYPQGMVNRKSVLNFQAWGGAIQEILNDSASDYLNLLASVQLSGTNMQVNINGNFKQDYPEDGEINVIAMIVEDNINARQQKHDGIDKDYIHSHVLRSVISDDVWGDKVLDSKPAEGDEFTKQYTAVLNAEWKSQDLALVVVAVNAKSREVLQAAYAHMK